IVPSDVSLLANNGATVTLAASSDAPALRVTGGLTRPLIRGLTVQAGTGPGVLVSPGAAWLVSVNVVGSKKSGLVVDCEQEDCGQRETVVDDCTLDRNTFGVWAIGATVSFHGG